MCFFPSNLIGSGCNVGLFGERRDMINQGLTERFDVIHHKLTERDLTGLTQDSEHT